MSQTTHWSSFTKQLYQPQKKCKIPCPEESVIKTSFFPQVFIILFFLLLSKSIFWRLIFQVRANFKAEYEILNIDFNSKEVMHELFITTPRPKALLENYSGNLTQNFPHPVEVTNSMKLTENYQHKPIILFFCCLEFSFPSLLTQSTRRTGMLPHHEVFPVPYALHMEKCVQTFWRVRTPYSCAASVFQGDFSLYQTYSHAV